MKVKNKERYILHVSVFLGYTVLGFLLNFFLPNFNINILDYFNNLWGIGEPIFLDIWLLVLLELFLIFCAINFAFKTKKKCVFLALFSFISIIFWFLFILLLVEE